MSYQVFARKYRPKTFQDVLGQDHVVQTLKNAIDQERLAHAYLFVGPRGTGKTSTARILAKALNCPGGPSVEFDPEHEICREIAEGASLDVLEIDGASNNGVEQVRDLRDNVRFAPSQGKFKIYYIDEVHMLTTGAFNALLKTLEEPPEHVKFIFATTEPNKILPTIISRCQRFDLRPISTEVIAKHLQFIASEEGVELSDAGAWVIAKGADGGMRDAQSMLDQLVAFCGHSISEQNVLDVFGFTSREIIADLCTSILKKDTPTALQLLHEQAKSGKDLSQLLDELISCIRIILVSKVDAQASSEGIPPEHWEKLTKATAKTSSEHLLKIVDLFAETENRMKWASNKRLHLEIGIIKAIQSLNEVRISDVIMALAGAAPLSKDELPSTLQKAEPPVEESRQDEKSDTSTVIEDEPKQETDLVPPSPKAEATSQPKASPDTPSPSQAAPSNSPTIAEKKGDEAAFGVVNFEALIEAAPEISPEPETVTPPPTPEPKQQEEAKKAVKKDEQPQLDESFYKDPLIQEALAMFKGRLIKS